MIRTPKCKQDTQAPEPSSSAHTPMTGIGDSTAIPLARDIRDTEQLETANDVDTRKTNSIEIKTSCAVEKAERDAYRSRTHGKRRAAENGNRQRCKQGKSDQPEEATVKEQRVDDIVMDQGPRDAGVTKLRMDEMLMDQVMAVSSGTSRVCVNEEKYEPATIRGLPADLVKKGQLREMKDLDDMNVLEWVEESTVPKDAQILDCG